MRNYSPKRRTALVFTGSGTTGAYHAGEVQYIFDTEPAIPSPGLDEDQQALADLMVKYWTRFAKVGDPNGCGAPPWPLYEAETDEYQSFVPPGAAPTADFAADHKCYFWAPAP